MFGITKKEKIKEFIFINLKLIFFFLQNFYINNKKIIMQTPVLLMTYRRPKNTKIILDILKNFKQKNIFVFNDGLKMREHYLDHLKTREVILNFRKKNKVKVIFPKKNLTQKKNLPFAISKVFRKFDKVIILEDDCIPNKSFLNFVMFF